ncbi:hypothetical protein CDAR_575451, partial [Caerostris darwini]
MDGGRALRLFHFRAQHLGVFPGAGHLHKQRYSLVRSKRFEEKGCD